MRQNASILIGLLWCLALLSVVVIGVLHTSRMDLMVVKNYGDRIQAHYLALAGIEKAQALLYRDAHDRSHSQKNHSGNFYDDPGQFRDVSFGRGTFSVLHRAGADQGGGIAFGVSDEEGRLNVNTAATNQLSGLQGMTPDVATAIVNWRGGDNSASAAEVQYYAGMQPPYQPRNSAYLTVRELLMVRGVTPEALLGRDAHQNGLLPSGPDDRSGSVDVADLGWASLMTVDSSVQNLNASGDDRVNVQTADENALVAVRGITPQIARAIVSYRGQHQLQGIADLLDVTRSQNQGGAGGQNQSTDGGSDQSGNKVISANLFMEIADDVTTDTGKSLAGVININTASVEVLMCMPNVTRELAQEIISQRQSGGYFANVGELLKVPDMSRDIFKQIAPLVTARSETYRILSEGRVTSTGTRQRIQAIVHVGLNSVSTLSWREDDL